MTGFQTVVPGELTNLGGATSLANVVSPTRDCVAVLPQGSVVGGVILQGRVLVVSDNNPIYDFDRANPIFSLPDNTAFFLNAIAWLAPHIGSTAEVGPGLPGAAAPTLLVTGCPTQGGMLGLAVPQGVPAARGVLVLGDQLLNLPLLGATLYPNPAILLGHSLSANGDFSLGVPVPVSGVSVNIILQSLYLDPAAPQGLSTTQGIRVRIP